MYYLEDTAEIGWLVGWLVDWLVGWLVLVLRTMQQQGNGVLSSSFLSPLLDTGKGMKRIPLFGHYVTSYSFRTDILIFVLFIIGFR